jgi:hypothetical protein
VAQRIQSACSTSTDLKPTSATITRRRCELLDAELGIPLVAAVEDYVQARKLAESESLTSMANDYRRVFKPLTRRATVPELVAELLVARKQDGASKAYVSQPQDGPEPLRAAFPGEISASVPRTSMAGCADSISASSRNSMLVCVKVLFSFARSQNCLPAEQMTAAEQTQEGEDQE